METEYDKMTQSERDAYTKKWYEDRGISPASETARVKSEIAGYKTNPPRIDPQYARDCDAGIA